MIFLKNKTSKEIYPFTDELWRTGWFEVHESSLSEDEEIIETLSEDEVLAEEIKGLPEACLEKDIVEQILDKPISNTVFNKAKKRVKK
jgi:hypothetical protein